jgi:hypothetical protein
MSQPANLYAEKVFSEHPLALWSLDDSSEFLSLISQENKKIVNWTVSGGTATTTQLSGISAPVVSPTTEIDFSATNQVIAISPDVISAQDLDADRGSFNISFYLYSQNSAIDSVDVGYEYTDGTTTQVLENFEIAGTGVWAFVSKTFDIPNTSSNLRIVIKINASSNGNYSCYINAISMAQWSENYATASSGVASNSLYSLHGASIGITNAPAVRAAAYGLGENPGYYLASENKMYAYNAGFPIVYGSSNATKIIENPNGPSLILPGLGLMNESGRYKDLTLEFWMRVSTSSYTATRIMGPVASTDGLYVDGQFLTFKLGNQTMSHFVGTWGRPMLVHLRFIENSISMLINGEEVVSMIVDTATIDLPARTNETLSSLFYGFDQDWIGFYGSDDFLYFDIESPALYSYSVPSVVAKRRFIYGQGVEYPENSNSSISGSAAIIDYRNSEYANNYLYPDLGLWNQGISENISTTSDSISAPDYQLPSVFLKNSNESDWLEACRIANTENRPYFSFGLDDETDPGGYLLFNSIDLLQKDLKAAYIVFRSDSTSQQTLFLIEDKVTGNYFEVSVSDSQLIYQLSYNSEITTVTKEDQHIVGISAAAGIDIDRFAETYGSSISSFFGAKSRLRMYVGGKPGYNNTFTGRIYKVGLSTARNLRKVSEFFTDDGTSVNIQNLFEDYIAADPSGIYGGDYDTTSTDFLDGGVPDSFLISSTLYGHTATYTLFPKLYLGAFILDVAVDSAWQDYLPLKYFAKNISDIEGNTEYALDYLQINLDSPTVYAEDGNSYDTSNASVKTYVSFQYLADGANILSENIANSYPAPLSRSVEPGDEWTTSKYEIVDGSIVFPPKNVSFDDIAVVIHIDMNIAGVQSGNIRISSLQIASQVQEESSLTPINTKLGQDIYPYIKKGIYYDYSAPNPVQIYKNSSPYLYICDDTGIQLVGDASADRAIRFPINPQRSATYRVGGVQMLMRYHEQSFPTTPEKVMTISSRDQSIIGYVVAEESSQTRGRLYFENEAGVEAPGVSLFINGNLVRNGYLLGNEWNMIGVQIAEPLNMDSFSGFIDISGNIGVDLVSSYKIAPDKTGVTTKFRTWAELESILDDEGINPATWGNFLSHVPAITWANVLYIPTTIQYLIDIAGIYKTYIGTNKFIVSDTSSLLFNNYKYRAYIGAVWNSSVVSPV